MAPVEKSRASIQQEQEEGHKAGIAFATDKAEYRDLLMLRRFLESPCDSDFAAELFSHYPDLSYGEFADRLFGDEEAEPSNDFILAFARAAVEVLEEIERRKAGADVMNALDPTAEERRRLNAMIDGATADDPSVFFENLFELANYYDPRAAFLRLRRHGTFPLSLRALFARCWVRYGDGWRSKVNDDLLVVDVLRCLLPPYEGPGLTLYRGDSAFNRRRRTYGMSWSASRSVAADFAQRNRRLYSDGSVLLEAEAPPDAIVFAPALHVNDYAEDEYVVDRRRLRNVRVLERFTC